MKAAAQQQLSVIHQVLMRTHSSAQHPPRAPMKQLKPAHAQSLFRSCSLALWSSTRPQQLRAGSPGAHDLQAAQVHQQS